MLYQGDAMELWCQRHRQSLDTGICWRCVGAFSLGLGACVLALLALCTLAMLLEKP